MELREDLLKFITNIVSYANLELLQLLKNSALKQWENKLLTDSEHCTIEAYLDLKINSLKEVI